MTPENKAFLDSVYGHWITLRDAQYLRGLNIHERTGMLRVLREEFWPGYTYDEWCGSCVTQMVRHLFERYDKWLSEQAPPDNKPAPPSNEPRGYSNNFDDNKGSPSKPKNHHRK